MRVLLFFLFITFLIPVNAVELADLYQGRVPVKSRDNAERREATKAALEQVVVKLTGSQTVRNHEALKRLFRQASKVLLSYSYQGDRQLELVVNFDAERINQQLQRAGLPIWGSQRPETLFWLSVDSLVSGRTVLIDEGPFARLLKKDAERLGLPMSLPLMDLQDTMQVSENDVWGNFVNPVARASERYQADFFAIGSVGRYQGQWSHSLRLYDSRNPAGLKRPEYRFEGQQKTLKQAIAALTEGLAGFYAGQYGVITSAQAGQVFIDVELMDHSLEQLVELERYLTRLAPIKELFVQQVQGTQVTLALDLIGGWSDVERLLMLESRMVPVPSDLESNPSYRWQR